MLKKRWLLLLIFTVCFSVAIFGQVPQGSSVVHNIHKINSRILGEERTVLVRVPANYVGRDEKFPVVYMLDAHAPQNSMMVGIIEQQSWGGMMPEMIVVGIQNTNRTRDLTPTKIATNGRQRRRR